jgi:hypothetical protein
MTDKVAGTVPSHLDLELVKAHGLDLGMYPPMQLRHYGDALKFERPEGLTIYGERLLAFAKAVRADERERCAVIAENEPDGAWPPTGFPRDIAAAIRQQGRE